MSIYQVIKKGGVTSAKGFLAAGGHCGIKKSGKKDLALVFSEMPCVLGATYTQSDVKAAPVRVSMAHSRKGKKRAVVFSSGNANACTGVKGIQDAKSMVRETAQGLQVLMNETLVCSTGRIGVPLPIDLITKGIQELVPHISAKGGRDAAEAIMTSDTCMKEYAVSFEIEGKEVIVGGMAKGAGMIHPNMATMLCCVTTDVAIDGRVLQRLTSDAVEQTFNRISVDGDTSTNDTVFVLANGEAGNEKLRKQNEKEVELFYQALCEVMWKLARMIVADGERITKVVELQIKGASSERDAQLHAEAISHSPLVKSSWAGGDPNWGRLMAALGYSNGRVREETVDIYYDGLGAVRNGLATDTPVSQLKRVVAKKSFTITIELHLGKGSYHMLVNDLTEGYVTFNKSE